MRHIVGVGDMKVSSDPADVIVTHALGTCLGIVVHDPVARVGGMLHVMLPTSTINPDKARLNPYMFVDTGVPELFRQAYEPDGMTVDEFDTYLPVVKTLTQFNEGYDTFVKWVSEK